MNSQAIWFEFRDKLFAFINSKINNKHSAEDILQDVFRKIHNNIKTLKSSEKIESWVYQITRNTITDFYRKKIAMVSADGIDIENNSDEEKKSYSEEHFTQCLLPLVRRLPDEYKEAILLTEYEGMSQKELAEKKGISVSGAKSRVQRARKKLKNLMLDCCHIEFDKYGNILDHFPRKNRCSCYDEC